jgi:hypothetical protein
MRQPVQWVLTTYEKGEPEQRAEIRRLMARYHYEHYRSPFEDRDAQAQEEPFNIFRAAFHLGVRGWLAVAFVLVILAVIAALVTVGGMAGGV